MNRTILCFCLLTLATAPTVGCKSKETQVAGAQPMSAELAKRLEAAFAEYESLRAALAADRLGDVAAIAGRLEASAKAAKKDAPGPVAGQLDLMATAAAGLKTGGKPDDQRRIFGDVSRAVVTLLSQHPPLAKARHIFECPMSQGYPKWVQTAQKIENPYMGQRMLQCGATSQWAP